MPHAERTDPVVHWSRTRAEREGTPLIVALHGRGADERTFSEIAPYLPEDASIAFVRAPIAEGDGYAWFANRGIGRPIAESISASAGQLFDWLDEVAASHTTVSLLGFSGGMAMAGGLLLAQPQRFSSAVLLSGTLPWDAGLPTETGRLNGHPRVLGAGRRRHRHPGGPGGAYRGVAPREIRRRSRRTYLPGPGPRDRRR